jgi:hypothetical protein
MKFALQTRHRRIVILTGDDIDAVDEISAVVDNTGGDFEPAPPPFGFAQPDEDDDE